MENYGFRFFLMILDSTDFDPSDLEVKVNIITGFPFQMSVTFLFITLLC